MNKLYMLAICVVASICVASAEVVDFDPCNLPAAGEFL